MRLARERRVRDSAKALRECSAFGAELTMRGLILRAVVLLWGGCHRLAAAHGGAHNGDSVPGSWPCFGQNTQRQAAATGTAAWNRALWGNVSSARSEAVEAYQHFHYHTGAPIRASPVLGKNSHHVYIISSDGILHAVHASDHTKHWNVSLSTGNVSNSLLHATATVSPDGAFVFAIGPGLSKAPLPGGPPRVMLHKIATANGTLQWQTTLSAVRGRSFSSPACSADGSAVFVGVDNAATGTSVQPSGLLYKISAADGSLLWRSAVNFEIGASSPAISTDEGVVYVGGNDHRTHAYMAVDGTERWASPVLPSDHTTTPDDAQCYSTPAASRDGIFLYAGGGDGRLHAMFASDGTELWVYPRRADAVALSTMQSSPAISHDDRTIFIGSSDGRMHAVDAASGTAHWTFDLPDGSAVVSSPMVHADGTVVFGCQDHYVRALNSTTGELVWKFLTEEAIVGSPAVSGDGRTVYIGGLDSKLYAIRLRIQTHVPSPSSSSISDGESRSNTSTTPGQLPPPMSPSHTQAPSPSSSSSFSMLEPALEPTKESNSTGSSDGADNAGEAGVASDSTSDGSSEDKNDGNSSYSQDATVVAAIACGGALLCIAVAYTLKQARKKGRSMEKQHVLADLRNGGDWIRMAGAGGGSETSPTGNNSNRFNRGRIELSHFGPRE